MNALELLERNLSARHLSSLRALFGSLDSGGRESGLPTIEELLELSEAAPAAPEERLALAAERIVTLAFGDTPPAGPITRENAPRESFELRLAAVDFLLSCVARVLDSALLRVRPPDAVRGQVAELESRLRTAFASIGDTLSWREHREQLLMSAFARFYERLRARLFRGQFAVFDEETLAQLVTYLKEGLYSPRGGRHYVEVLREALSCTQRDSFRLPLESVPEQKSPNDTPLSEGPGLTRMRILHELGVLNQLIEAEKRVAPTNVLRHWRAFLHGILRDGLREQPALSFAGDAGDFFTPVDGAQSADVERGEKVRNYCEARREWLAESAFHGDPAQHDLRLETIRSAYEDAPDCPELPGGEFLAWLHAEYAERRDPRVDCPPTESIDTLEKSIKDQVQNAKRRHLIPALKDGLERLGLVPDDYIFIYRSALSRRTA